MIAELAALGSIQGLVAAAPEGALSLGGNLAVVLFGAGSRLALIAWGALSVSLFIPRIQRTIWAITGFVIPAALAVPYTVLMVQGWGDDPQAGFGSIEQVRRLFLDDRLLTAGWLHYLAFDLFIGTWLAKSGTSAGAPALLLLCCLPPTFLFGPTGFFLGFLVVTCWRRWTWPELP